MFILYLKNIPWKKHVKKRWTSHLNLWARPSCEIRKGWHLQGAKKELPSVFRPSTCFSRNTGSAEGTTCVFLFFTPNGYGTRWCFVLWAFFLRGTISLGSPKSRSFFGLNGMNWWHQNSGKLTSWGWYRSWNPIVYCIWFYRSFRWLGNGIFRTINYVWICKGWGLASWDFTDWWYVGGRRRVCSEPASMAWVTKGRTRWRAFNMPPWRIIPVRK